MLNEWSAEIMWPNEEFCKKEGNHRETWAVTNGFCTGCGKRDISQWNPETDKNQLFEFLEKLQLNIQIEYNPYSISSQKYLCIVAMENPYTLQYEYGENLNTTALQAIKKIFDHKGGNK